ncbi:hypothetical protein PanWU01x14_318750, partial [Parasponia andersonii]
EAKKYHTRSPVFRFGNFFDFPRIYDHHETAFGLWIYTAKQGSTSFLIPLYKNSEIYSKKSLSRKSQALSTEASSGFVFGTSSIHVLSHTLANCLLQPVNDSSCQDERE